MKAAEHDRHAFLAELIGELIRAQRRADGGGHADQIPSAVEVDVFEALVAQRHVIVVGSEAGHQRDHQSHDEPPAGLMRRAVEVNRGWLDQEYPGFLVHQSLMHGAVVRFAVRTRGVRGHHRR